MTPTSVMNDLIYVERYHRSHGAPMTADIMTRARSLIRKQSLALGSLDEQNPEPVVVVLVSELDAMAVEMKRLRGLVDTQARLLSKSKSSVV